MNEALKADFKFFFFSAGASEYYGGKQPTTSMNPDEAVASVV